MVVVKEAVGGGNSGGYLWVVEVVTLLVVEKIVGVAGFYVRWWMLVNSSGQ